MPVMYALQKACQANEILSLGRLPLVEDAGAQSSRRTKNEPFEFGLFPENRKTKTPTMTIPPVVVLVVAQGDTHYLPRRDS